MHYPYAALNLVILAGTTSAFSPQFNANHLTFSTLSPPLQQQYDTLTSTSLDAKAKKKKKKKATTTSTGGFGKVEAKRAPSGGSGDTGMDSDDYANFPPLNPKIAETLLPSGSDFPHVAQDLPKELYERLGQIYGFRDFNYPEGWFDEEEEKAEEKAAVDDFSMSMTDLISSGGGDGASSSPATVSSLSSDSFGGLLKDPAPSSTSATPAPTPAVTAKSAGDISDLIAAATGGEAEDILSAVTGDASSSSSAPTLDISKLEQFSKFRVLHVDPMVLAVDDFFTSDECDKYVNLAKDPKKQTSNNNMPMMSRSKTVGKDSLSKSQRTSTTWFHHFSSVPELIAKATRLMGLDTIARWEEPQTVRYQPTEKFTWHLDALAPSDTLTETGGQRVATLLVYLTDIGEDNGGSTLFRDLGGKDGEEEDEKYLAVKPKKGTALLFFPSAGGIPETPFDIRTLHAGEAMSPNAPDEKWIAQMWLREHDGRYKPTAPPGNSHSAATDAVNAFCNGV